MIFPELYRNVEDWQLLGSNVLNASATNIIDITIPEKNYLWIVVHALDLSSEIDLEFNGAGGTAYWHRQLRAAAGGTTFSNAQSASQARILVNTSINSTTRGSLSNIFVINRAATSKRVIINTMTATAAAGTLTDIRHHEGEWVNTSNLINRVRVFSSGATSCRAGSSAYVFGKDET